MIADATIIIPPPQIGKVGCAPTSEPEKRELAIVEIA